MNILATFSAEASEWFDALMLIAFVLFVAATATAKTEWKFRPYLLPAGLAAAALAWLLL